MDTSSPRQGSFRPAAMRASDIFSLAILLLFLCTGNLYLMPSGLPQISHYLLFIGVITLITARFLGDKLAWGRAGSIAVIFGLLTFSINMIYFVFMPDKIFLLSSFFYIFNALVFVFIVMLFRSHPKQTLNIVYAGVCISTLVEVIALLAFPDIRGGRSYGTFNNPNQLAYWTIFTAGILILIRADSKLLWYDLIILLVLFWIQTLTLSKAGIISYTLLLVGLPFYRIIPTSYRLIIGAIACLITIIVLFNVAYIASTAERLENISNAVDRIENIGQESDDNLRARGYMRPVEYPHYLLVGAGEGGYSRFLDMRMYHDEIHSGLLNVLFSYGIIGFIIFCMFLYSVIKRAPPVFLLILFVILLNGLTHQNVRFTYFWITMAVAYGVYRVRIKENDMNMPTIQVPSSHHER